jgi:Domain of unknown function DUF11
VNGGSGAKYCTRTPRPTGPSDQGGTVSCRYSSRAVGTSGTMRIAVVPTVSGTLVNNAYVTTAMFDPNSANNKASATTTVLP